MPYSGGGGVSIPGNHLKLMLGTFILIGRDADTLLLTDPPGGEYTFARYITKLGAR